MAEIFQRDMHYTPHIVPHGIDWQAWQHSENGEGFVRIAMVENEQRIRQAARNIKSYLKSQGVNVPPSRED